MKLEDFDIKDMIHRTGIAAVTIEAAMAAENGPGFEEAEAEASRRFEKVEATLPAAMIIYRRMGISMASPLEFAVIRRIARRFFQKHAPTTTAP